MKMSYHQYELQPRSSLQKKRLGSLLRVKFSEGIVGYADCHPWSELGDQSLEEQLKLLAQGITTTLTERSLQFARLDAEARAQKINLFSGVRIPNSHFLLPHLDCWNSLDVEEIKKQGFSHVKVKLGNDLKKQTTKLRAFLSYLPLKVKVRLDFNLQLTPQLFETFLRELEDDKQQIDFYEDPFPFHLEQWAQFQDREEVNLACDWQSHQAVGYPNAAKIVVIKPAVQDITPFLKAKSQRLIVTTYLDHPLGQLAAAYTAGQFANDGDPCGLASHRVYQTNPFSEQLSMSGATLIPPVGFGFGFDALLSKLSWTMM